MDVLLQDVRYGLRTLLRSPVFTSVAVVSLALGIGVNIAIFSFINAALFKPLAAARPAELASLYHTSEKGNAEFYSTSYPEFEFYRDHNSVFSGMLAYLRVPVVVGSGAGARQVSGELVSPGYFTLLGVQPAAGSFFGNNEHGQVAVISRAFWRERFGEDPAAIGQALQIGAAHFTVIGVAPSSFRGIVMDWADPPSVWLPVEQYKQAVPVFPIDIVHAWGMEGYLITARLRRGVSVAQANAQLASLTVRLREAQNRRLTQRAVIFPVQEARFWPAYRGSIVTFLGVMMAIVGVILLIACCNLANLLLARAANRSREIAMRLALGAEPCTHCPAVADRKPAARGRRWGRRRCDRRLGGGLSRAVPSCFPDSAGHRYRLGCAGSALRNWRLPPYRTPFRRGPRAANLANRSQSRDEGRRRRRRQPALAPAKRFAGRTGGPLHPVARRRGHVRAHADQCARSGNRFAMLKSSCL